MSAFHVAAMPPQPTGEQILENLRRLLQPTLVRFSPAVAPGTAIGLIDDGRHVVVCSWQDREAISAAIQTAGDGRFELDPRGAA